MEVTKALAMQQQTTPEQDLLFSLYFDERRAYAIGAVVIQVIWALCDMPAFMAIILSVAQYLPFLTYVYMPLSFGIVFSLHFILKATLNGELYFMFQTVTFVKGKAKGLDWFEAKRPFGIALVLFALSTVGLYLFEKENGYKADFKPIENTTLLKENEAIESSFLSLERSIEKSAAAKEKAELSDFDRKIANLKTKKPINNWHKSQIANDLAEVKAKRNKAAARIATEKAVKLDSLTSKKTTTLLQASNRFEKQSSFLSEVNKSELAKQQVSETLGSKYSWILSFMMMVLFIASQTRLSSLNFQVGDYIKPRVRKKGSFFTSLLEVFDDILYCRGNQFITFIHKHGSLAIVERPDSTRGITEGTYNASQLQNVTESQQGIAESQQTATEAENAEAVITAAQQEAVRLQQIETERVATERAAFEAEKQRLVDERAAFEAKQREAKAEEERLMRERLAKLEAERQQAEAARLQQIETAKQLELQKAQQERNRAQQLEREKQEREAKAQQLQKEKDESDRVAQQLLQEKLAASETFSKLMEKVRTDLSNLRHDNGTFESVTKRLGTHFETLAVLNTKKYLTDANEKKLASRWEEFQNLLKQKEVKND
jgi:hypothetical protein